MMRWSELVMMKEAKKNGTRLVGRSLVSGVSTVWKRTTKKCRRKIKLIFLFSFSYPFNVLRRRQRRVKARHKTDKIINKTPLAYWMDENWTTPTPFASSSSSSSSSHAHLICKKRKHERRTKEKVSGNE